MGPFRAARVAARCCTVPVAPELNFLPAAMVPPGVPVNLPAVAFNRCPLNPGVPALAVADRAPPLANKPGVDPAVERCVNLPAGVDARLRISRSLGLDALPMWNLGAGVLFVAAGALAEAVLLFAAGVEVKAWLGELVTKEVAPPMRTDLEAPPVAKPLAKGRLPPALLFESPPIRTRFLIGNSIPLFCTLPAATPAFT